MTTDDAVDDDTVLRVRYGAWRRWVRAMRARGGRRRALTDGADPHERAYLVYGLVLVVVVYAPILWTALARAAAPLGTEGSAVRETLVSTGAVVVGTAALAGVLLHRLGAPLWVTPTDAAYALAGGWDPRVVLWRRVVVVVVATAVTTGLVGAAVASGALHSHLRPGTGVGWAALAWGACAAGAAMLPLALATAAQCPRWRTLAQVSAVVVAGIGVLVAVQGADLVVRDACAVAGAACAAAPSLGPPPEAVAWAVGIVVVVVPVLLAVLPGHLDVDATAAAGRRVAVAGVGLQGGDAAGVRTVLGPSRSGRRTGRLAPRVLAVSPVLARDLLGLRRRPLGLVGSVLCGAVGVALLVAASDAGVLAAVVGGLVLYGASGTWTAGLRSTAEQPVPGGLLPGGLGRQVAAHLVAPGGLALVAVTAGAAVAASIGRVEGWSAVAPAVAVVAVVLGARAWVAGASTVPVALFTPVPGPTGDLAMVSVAAWYLRGWLLVAGVAWATQRWGVGVVVLAAGLAWVLVRSAVGRLARE